MTDIQIFVHDLEFEETDSMLKGTCLCKTVEYEVADEFGYSLNCHCSNCRRATGAACKPFAGIERNKLQIVRGANSLLIYGDEIDNDTHCALCGSLLFSVVRDGQFVHVTLGTLVDTPSIKPDAHIFVGSKASWFEITDGLPQFKEFPE